MLKVTCCRSKCCVQSGLDFEATGSSVGHHMLQGNFGAINTINMDAFMVECGSTCKNAHPSFLNDLYGVLSMGTLL